MSTLQDKLNALGDCCDEWKDIEVITTHQITIKERVCIPVTQQAPLTQQVNEIESKLQQIDIPPNLTGEVTLIRKTWNLK
jgi:uncharacterized protein YqgV (UPF0045/DUF77 family)